MRDCIRLILLLHAAGEIICLHSLASQCCHLPCLPTPCACADDISGVSLWPFTDDLTRLSQGMGLSIWLHSTANFTTDANKVKCIDGLDLITRYEVYTQCPSTTGVRYVSLHPAQHFPAHIAFPISAPRLPILSCSCGHGTRLSAAASENTPRGNGPFLTHEAWPAAVLRIARAMMAGSCRLCGAQKAQMHSTGVAPASLARARHLAFSSCVRTHACPAPCACLVHACTMQLMHSVAHIAARCR